MCTPGSENKVMHANLRIGETVILASDGRCTGQMSFAGFSLSLTVKSTVDADHFFAARVGRRAGANAAGKTFFSPRFGMVADRFGVSWMVYVTP